MNASQARALTNAQYKPTLVDFSKIDNLILQECNKGNWFIEIDIKDFYYNKPAIYRYYKNLNYDFIFYAEGKIRISW